MDLISKIGGRAKELGFDLFGVADPNVEKSHVEFFQKWLKEGHAGQMKPWLERGVPKRENPREILPGVKSVLCLAINYYPGDHKSQKNKVARYAWGDDYHEIIADKSKLLCEYLKELGDENPLWYADTGAIFERYFAYKAGLGFVGKNTCLITKEFGSWVFLSVILTKLELVPTGPKYDFSLCGSCRKCLDSCPAGALREGNLDARKCISYLTIEKKGEFPDKERRLVASQNYCFGCDICQEVCPHNGRAKKTSAFRPKFETLNESDIVDFSIFKGSPIKRAKREGILRNLKTMAS